MESRHAGATESGGVCRLELHLAAGATVRAEVMMRAAIHTSSL
jgi:hypothetical protein